MYYCTSESRQVNRQGNRLTVRLHQSSNGRSYHMLSLTHWFAPIIKFCSKGHFLMGSYQSVTECSRYPLFSLVKPCHPIPSSCACFHITAVYRPSWHQHISFGSFSLSMALMNRRGSYREKLVEIRGGFACVYLTDAWYSVSTELIPHKYRKSGLLRGQCGSVFVFAITTILHSLLK